MDIERTDLLQADQSVVHTVAQLKGRRLRMARALTGFSRQELYQKIGIATSTMDTWESGRVELTEKSAVRICNAFRNAGIYCSSEWLLTGAGVPPRMMDDVEKSIFIPGESVQEAPVLNHALCKIPPFLDEEIRRELSFFINVHEKAIFHIVSEDFMNSRYKSGDCVAGIEDRLQNLVGRVIIAQLNSGKTMLCKLLNCSNEISEVFFSCSDQNTKVKIVKAAEILWHRMSKKRN